MFIARNASQLSCTPIFYLVPEKGHSGLQLKGMNLTRVTTLGKILRFGPKTVCKGDFYSLSLFTFGRIFANFFEAYLL